MIFTIFVNMRLSLVSNLIHRPLQHGLMFGSSYLNHLELRVKSILCKLRSIIYVSRLSCTKFKKTFPNRTQLITIHYGIFFLIKNSQDIGVKHRWGMDDKKMCVPSIAPILLGNPVFSRNLWMISVNLCPICV